MAVETITSASNPKIKKLVALQQKSSERRQSALFVVEGRRELEHCIRAGFSVDSIFCCPELASGDVLSALEAEAAPALKGFVPPPARGRAPFREGESVRAGADVAESAGRTAHPKVFEVSREIYEKIAYRESTEGIIAEVHAKELTLQDLDLGENPLVMVLESVEKPGNLGAVLRSADAAGVTAVLVCDPKTDLYNPNLIRASIGAIFTVPCVACTSEEAIRFLKDKGIQILTAQLQDSQLYYDQDMKRGTAIVMGTEATGLTDIWRKAADAHIRIPMLGQLDSLNVSVSAAILLYESVRQRNNG